VIHEPTINHTYRHHIQPPNLACRAALLLAVTLGLSAVGLPDGTPAVLGPVTMLQALLSSGLVAAAYLVAGFGYAAPVCRWLCPAVGGNRYWLQLGVGLGTMLWLSHGLGVLGAWRLGTVVAILVVVVGIGLCVADLVRGSLDATRDGRDSLCR